MNNTQSDKKNKNELPIGRKETENLFTNDTERDTEQTGVEHSKLSTNIHDLKPTHFLHSSIE